MAEHYLGDGLYASINGEGMIKLRAPRDGVDHIVYLDADVLRNFEDYVTHIRKRIDRIFVGD